MQTLDDTCRSNHKAIDWTTASVQEFLKITTADYCCKNLAICGAQYKQNIVFSENNLKTRSFEDDDVNMATIPNPTRLQFLAAPLQKQPDYIKGYDETYQIVNKVSDQYRDLAKTLPQYEGKP